MIDDQLTFSDHIAKTAWSCRFALFSIKKVRPFLSEHASQLLVQALVLSRLDYCNALLAGLPASSIKLKNVRHTSVYQFALTTNSCSHKFKALMFAYKTTTGSAPLYLNSLLQTYVPSRSLRSAGECCFIVPSQRGTKSLSLTFKLNVPSWWNDLPSSIRAAESIHLQESAKNTSLPSLFDPLTLALSILILFLKKTLLIYCLFS